MTSKGKIKLEMEDNIEWVHLRAVLENFAVYFQNKLQENMRANDSNASGNLVNSFKTEVKIEDSYYEVGINLADYWYYVNNGRGPTRGGGNGTLLEKIKNWIIVKRIVPHVGVIKTGKNAGKQYLPKINQLAFLITRKIHREGYEGTHFFDEAKADSIEYFKESIDLAIREDVESYVFAQVGLLRTIFN